MVLEQYFQKEYLKKDKILVGSDGDYIAVCRKCYIN